VDWTWHTHEHTNSKQCWLKVIHISEKEYCKTIKKCTFLILVLVLYIGVQILHIKIRLGFRKYIISHILS